MTRTQVREPDAPEVSADDGMTYDEVIAAIDKPKDLEGARRWAGSHRCKRCNGRAVLDYYAGEVVVKVAHLDHCPAKPKRVAA